MNCFDDTSLAQTSWSLVCCSSMSSSLNSVAAVTWEDLLKTFFRGLSESQKTSITKVLGRYLHLLACRVFCCLTYDEKSTARCVIIVVWMQKKLMFQLDARRSPTKKIVSKIVLKNFWTFHFSDHLRSCCYHCVLRDWLNRWPCIASFSQLHGSLLRTDTGRFHHGCHFSIRKRIGMHAGLSLTVVAMSKLFIAFS